MAFFFATAEDLLPVLLHVESKLDLVYTPYGHVFEPKATHYHSARELPTLFQPQPHESYVLGPCYVVTEANTRVNLHHFVLNDGRDCWAIDQLFNNDSTVLCHGGIYKKNVLLRGEVRTAYKTKLAQRLQRAFDSAIRKQFVKIQAFYVGPAAEKLLDLGCRLTSAEQCPILYDLRRKAMDPTDSPNT